jgi:hypothetical protein
MLRVPRRGRIARAAANHTSGRDSAAATNHTSSDIWDIQDVIASTPPWELKSNRCVARLVSVRFW